jgi:hypothetical protein
MPSCCIRIFRDSTGEHLNDEPVDSRVTKSLIENPLITGALRTNKQKETHTLVGSAVMSTTQLGAVA